MIAYGRGRGLGRCRGVGLPLGVTVRVGVAVAVGIDVGLGVGVVLKTVDYQSAHNAVGRVDGKAADVAHHWPLS